MIASKKILGIVRKACEEYKMIVSGDKIAVGVSGGKDSLTLLCGLADMRSFYSVPYEVCAITLDMGYGADYTAIAELCEKLGVEYRVAPSNIQKIVFEYREEKNPCSLCAKLRRGILNKTAVEIGCNKVALGHHMDDAAETFMMNLLNGSKIACFRPVTYLDKVGLTVIRPLLYATEGEVRGFAEKVGLPIIPSGCPIDGDTERQKVKELIQSLSGDYHGLRRKIFRAMQEHGLDGF